MAAIRVEERGVTEPGPGLPAPTAPRVAWLDRLKTGLVALIIAGHAILAYGSLENAWPYQPVQEVHLGAASDTVVDLVVIPVAMFAMGLFFLLSGMVAPGSLGRRGPTTYVRSRLLRLGLPLVIWTLVLWPTAIWLAYLAAGEGHSPLWELIHHEPLLDTGPMWFVLVLLVFSIVYAAWSAWTGPRPAHPGGISPTPITTGTLTRLAVAISLANLLVRPFFPAGGDELLQVHLWQWPQCVALFCLGVVAARPGWPDRLPDHLLRRAGRLALIGVVGFAVVAVALALSGTDGGEIFEGGLHWPALALGLVEGPMAVGASVGLLGLAQRRLDRRPGPLGQALARGAYGAFVLQGVVLIGLMIAMRPVDVPAEAKALLVAGAGVGGSFGIAWLLVTRTPLGRIL